MKVVPDIEEEVTITGKGFETQGILTLPTDAFCLVIFAHGSGSSKISKRNRYVAQQFNRSGMATLLLDLLTANESSDRGNVFDIELLASRLAMATSWARKFAPTSSLPVGYFGSSTGAAAALKASVYSRNAVGAIVSRGGRPDLAWEVLDRVEAPTLFIVGSSDYGVVELNESSYNKLKCKKKFEIVPDATHLFEEPGALEKVAELASEWFLENLEMSRSYIP